MRTLSLLQIIVVSILSLSLSPHDLPATPVQPADSSLEPLAVIRPLEVRTRRLHMVRPDLLHYPIQYDLYC